MDEIERLFSNELTKLTNEQLKKLIDIETLHMDDIVLQMFTKTTEKLREKNDNELTGIFQDLIKLEDDDKLRTIENQIKHVAINRVTSNVEIVSNIEKSAYDKVIESVDELKTDVTEPNDIENQIKDAAINKVTSNVAQEKVIDIENQIKDAAINKVNNYFLENNYVNNYPRKQVGIENSHNGGKVICYANSVLQMLYSLPYYRSIISEYNSIIRNDSLLPINELFVNMNNNNTHNNFVIPKNINNCPSNVYNFVFKNYRETTVNNVKQEDADEYLNYCLDILPSYAIDEIKFNEFTKKQCNNEKNTTKDETLSVSSSPATLYELIIQVSGSSITECIENYSNEDMELNTKVIEEHKKGIKKLMLENLYKTIPQLIDVLPKNDQDKLNDVLEKSFYNNIIKLFNLRRLTYNNSVKIIDLLHVLNDNNTFFLLRELFELYITLNKVLYNIKSGIESKNETEFINGCIKYPESKESDEYYKYFESIDDFEKYIEENDDYLVVIKKKIIEFIIPPENRYLFICLKRFHQNNDNTRIKLTNRVVPDKTLIIGGVRYTLSGVICHIGPYDNGHYIYIQCNQNGEYVILYDDEKVYDYAANAVKNQYYRSDTSDINEAFINENGYLFSYSRYPVDQNVKNTPAKQTNAAALVKKKP